MLRIVCCALALCAFALAAPGSARAEPLVDTPVYNPQTGSYYELVRIGAGHSIRGATIAEIGWSRARDFAHSRTYKGVRGRLAMVTDASVNDFLRSTFQPSQPTWIGLRYWCQYGKLQLVNGEFYPKDAYTNWDKTWAKGGGERGAGGGRSPACNQNLAYWPVHYWPVQDGFRWNANGTAKEFRYLFIEYPTGKE